MKIAPYEPGMAPLLADAWNQEFADVPHCPPITANQWHSAMAGISNAPPFEPLPNQRVWVALEDEHVLACCHVGLRDGPPRDDGQLERYREGKLGVIASFWHRVGYGKAAASLLELAEDHMRSHSARTIRAWHYDETYPFYHLEHAYLSGALVHVEATLGLAGYVPTQAELCLAHPALPDGGTLSPPPDVALSYDWHRDEPQPSLVLRARRDSQEIGICVCVPAHPNTDEPRLLKWLYTPWLGIAQSARRHGLGRFLLLKAMDAMSREGYDRAAICCIGSNYPALALYSGLDYRIIDRTHIWLRYLD